MDVPATRYARSGDLSIAYQVLGSGPIDLVYVPGFVSNIEIGWEFPAYAQTLRRLASFTRLILFDKRGTGLSDRTADIPTLEERMDDIRAVMDAAGSDKAAVLALSEGGQAAMVFAATYPERTHALILWASNADEGLYGDVGESAAVFDEFVGVIRTHWGNGRGLGRLLAGPDHQFSDRALLALGRWERNAATPAAAEAVVRRGAETVIGDALGTISVPTLVLHREEDPTVPVRVAQGLARRIPGARLVILPGTTHLGLQIGEDDDVVAEVQEFLTGARFGGEPERVLKTVLFTDIVGSTERAAGIGDRRWSELLDAHDSEIRRELEHYRGQEIKTTGDGFLAAFDGPARAVRCAHAIVDDARGLGLDVRGGVHTGECEMRGDDLAGLAVHIGARVASLAGPGEVLVTSTVRDLVVGSGLQFNDRGRHELKGVPGEWQLLAVVRANGQ